MANLRNGFYLLCTFFIVSAFIAPIGGNAIRRALLDKDLYRRSVDPQIADLPTKSNVDDPQVKKYAQEGVDKLSASGSKVMLDKVLEATFFPPAGKLLYEIKMNVKDGGNDKVCTVNVWRESDAEPSVTVECGQSRRRRTSDPQIADVPTKTNVDDPQVKKYAQEGVEKLSTPSELEKILEATFFPPSGKLLYEIKIKAANKENKDSKECTVNVWRERDGQSVTIDCDKTERRKRANEESTEFGKDYIADLPGKLSVTDPQVTKYAQQGLAEYAKKSPESEAVLVEIIEAYYVPVSIYSYNIKVKFGKKTCGKDCKDGDLKTEICNIYIPLDSERFNIDIKCGESKRKRETEEKSISDDDYIADLPAELSVTDLLIKKFSQLALEEYSKKHPKSEAVMLEIIEAFYIPESTFSHSIKIKFGKKECPKKNEKECEKELKPEVCTVYIPEDSDDSLSFECDETKKEKRDVESDSVGTLIMDKPLKINLDEPEVKKYAQKGVEIYGETSTDPNEPILEKIEDALLYPPSGKQLFEIKIKIGTSTCAKGQKENCQLKPGSESKPCTVNVLIENDKPQVDLKCN